MRRNVVLWVAVVSLGAVAAPGPARFKDRLDEFLAKAELARLKQKLPDREAALQRYPLAEVALVPAGALAIANPAKAVKVTAAGTIPKGALVAFDCDELQVSGLKVTRTGVTAQVRAPPFALPRTCNLHVVSPVSGADLTLPAVVLGGYRWELKLANGMEVQLRHDTRGTLQSTWLQDDHPLGTRSLWLELGDDRSLRATVQRVNEEANSRRRQWATIPEGREQQQLETKKERAARRIDTECTKLTGTAMQQCFAEVRAEIDGLKPRLDELFAFGQRWMTAHPIGCDSLELSVDAGGKVRGKGRGCIPDGSDYDAEGRLIADLTEFTAPPPPPPPPERNRDR